MHSQLCIAAPAADCLEQKSHNINTMASEGWVLPEKYEEGLLDEKGEPLSKRCDLRGIECRARKRTSAACWLLRVMAAQEDAARPFCSEFKRRQKLAQKEKEMAEKKVRCLLLPLPPPPASWPLPEDRPVYNTPCCASWQAVSMVNRFQCLLLCHLFSALPCHALWVNFTLAHLFYPAGEAGRRGCGACCGQGSQGGGSSCAGGRLQRGDRPH